MKMGKYLKTVIYTLVVFILITSCSDHKSKPGIKDYFDTNAPENLDSDIIFAEGFDIFRWNGISKIVVYHPELRQMVIGEYFVVPANIAQKFYDTVNMIVLPVDSVAVFSATQLNAFDKLNKLDCVVGISESKYIINENVKEMLKRGEVSELATTSDLFVEKTITVNPSLIFYSPFKVTESHALDVTGIPLIFYYDYFETDPLGRAEWIKFTATFFGEEGIADSIFNAIVFKYEYLKQMTLNIEAKPTLFSDKYFNGQWFVPGGKSYIAQLFKDAGANYLWKDDEHNASFPLDYEVVYGKAYDADYWRIIGSYADDATYRGLQAENELYRHFKAFKEKKVIYCNARESAYFETSPLEPHLILADLIKAFHPGLLPDYKPKYYQLLVD